MILARRLLISRGRGIGDSLTRVWGKSSGASEDAKIGDLLQHSRSGNLLGRFAIRDRGEKE
jgi:hypothetical protein